MYEDVPDYCFYYKHQGHVARRCEVKGKDEADKQKLVLNEELQGKDKQGEGSQTFQRMLNTIDARQQ